jgi:hypothetical protein
VLHFTSRHHQEICYRTIPAKPSWSAVPESTPPLHARQLALIMSAQLAQPALRVLVLLLTESLTSTWIPTNTPTLHARQLALTMSAQLAQPALRVLCYGINLNTIPARPRLSKRDDRSQPSILQAWAITCKSRVTGLCLQQLTECKRRHACNKSYIQQHTTDYHMLPNPKKSTRTLHEGQPALCAQAAQTPCQRSTCSAMPYYR